MGRAQAPISTAFRPARLLHDHPYGTSEVEARADRQRKYPTGDWMTSPQVFEEVKQDGRWQELYQEWIGQYTGEDAEPPDISVQEAVELVEQNPA